MAMLINGEYVADALVEEEFARLQTAHTKPMKLGQDSASE